MNRPSRVVRVHAKSPEGANLDGGYYLFLPGEGPLLPFLIWMVDSRFASLLNVFLVAVESSCIVVADLS